MFPRTFRLRPIPGDVRVAREHCAGTARAAYGDTCDELLGDAEMVTSELVTNAIRAGADLIVLEVDANSSGLYIAVRDDAAGEVVPRVPRALDTSGRGLHIVAAIAARWGVEPLPAGKRVWAELPAPGSVFDGLPAGLRDVAS